jgi:hypothetical protein
MEQIPIDGNTSLDDQQNSLRFIELAGPSRLLTYTRKTSVGSPGAKVNVATFQDLGRGDDVLDLFLVQVTQSENAVSVISSQLAQGRTVVFHERVFVKGQTAEVIGFR